MIGSDSHKSKYFALECPKMREKRHEMFYAPYKVILFVVSYSKLTGILHFFNIEEKSLSNH